MTQIERARALRMSTRMLRRYEAIGCPRELEAAKTWLNANRVRRGDGGQIQATARLRAAQADLLELKAAERRAGIIPAADVRSVCEKLLELFDVGEELASAVADDVANMTDAALIRARLLSEVRCIRGQVAQRFRELALEAALAAHRKKEGNADVLMSTETTNQAALPRYGPDRTAPAGIDKN